MNTILKRYKTFLGKFPIFSQSIQTGLLMGSGDLIAQTFIEKKSLLKLDLARTGKFTLIGMCLVGPSLRIWYGKIDQFFGSKGKMTAIKKVAADQLLFAPVFLCIVMVVINLSQNCKIHEVTKILKQDYFEVLKSNYLLWPAVQLLNFYLVPLEYQVIIVQTVALLWNTYLSWKINKSIQFVND